MRFQGRRGPVTSFAVWKIVKRYGRYAGLEDLRPHQLRHTYGRLLIEDGFDLAAVQKLMGHKRIETTLRYVQASAERLASAIERVG